MVSEQVLKDVSERFPYASLFGRGQVGVHAISDAGGRGLDGIAGEMGIAGGGLNLGMANQLPDHRQSLAKRQRTAREGVAEIMDSHIVSSSARARMHCQGC